MAELWFPDSGEIYKQAVEGKGEHTEVELRFGWMRPILSSSGSCCLHGRKPRSWSSESKQIADLSSDWNLEFSNGGSASMPKLRSWTELDENQLKYHSNRDLS